MKPAMLIIDMQEKFYHRGGIYKESYLSAIDYINDAMPLFRKKGLPVIHVYHQDDESGLIPGSEGFEFYPDIQIRKEDEKIIKTYGNAFNQTDLAHMLKQHDVNSVMLSGFCAEYCVLSTYHGAEDLDLNPFLLKNGIAGGVKKHIRFVESICETISLGPLSQFLN